MAKIYVEDQEDNTRVPFLRGILIRSLQDSGLSFDTAYKLATEIRDDLDDSNNTKITNHKLRQRILKSLKEHRASAEIINRYSKQLSPFGIQVEQRDGQVTAFSRVEYQHCLENIGLSSEEAIEIVATVHKHLLDRRIERMTSKHLSELTYRYLRQSSKLGTAVAQRWLIWRSFIKSGKPLIFLIGGTAGCGKSTIATTLASRLDIVRTQSTDMLREVMRVMMPKQLMPVLHTSSFTAWSALPGQPRVVHNVPENLLLSGYRSQADLLAVAIEAVIQRALREQVSLILEGVHIHPTIMEKLAKSNDAIVIPVMLGVLKRKQLQRRIQGRGNNAPQRRGDRYLKHFDEIWRLQSYLLSEADRTNIPIVVNTSRDKAFREIMRLTIEFLAEDFDSTAKAVFS